MSASRKLMFLLVVAARVVAAAVGQAAPTDPVQVEIAPHRADMQEDCLCHDEPYCDGPLFVFPGWMRHRPAGS